MFKVIAAVILFAPCAAYADAGLPMLALAWPLQWLALIPIVLLECELLRRQLQLSYKHMLWPTCKANLISTFVGIPVAWLVMFSIESAASFGMYLLPEGTYMPNSTLANIILLPLTAAWISGESVWQVYFAFVILTIPFCLISIYLEEGVIRKAFPELKRQLVHPAVVRANVWSYVVLSALALMFPLLNSK